MDKLMKTATLTFLVFLMFVGFAYASYWVYSEIVTVTVTDYTLSLSYTTDGLRVHLSGQLLGPDAQPVSSATIHIYRTESDGIETETLGISLTDVDGKYAYDWLASAEGTYYFKSGYDVP